MRKLMAGLLGVAVTLASAGTASAGTAAVTPRANQQVCGAAYARINLGHGDYFNVYNEPDHLSCISAERHALSWYVSWRSSQHGWEYPNISSGIEWGHYDIWFNRTYVSPRRLGQADGAEIMIWLMHPGVTVSASRICWTTEVQGLWYDAMCWRSSGQGKQWNYLAYIAERQTTVLKPTRLNWFFRDAISHGELSPNWWLTSIDFGAEMTTGGTGFAVRKYSLTGVR